LKTDSTYQTDSNGVSDRDNMLRISVEEHYCNL